MSRKALMLDRLARLAKIRSDAELKRFAAFREHLDALMLRKDAQKARLAGAFARTEAFSVAEARLANLEAGRLAREIGRLDAELQRMKPGFDAARARAMREFGRVQALERLAGDERGAAGRKGAG